MNYGRAYFTATYLPWLTQILVIGDLEYNTTETFNISSARRIPSVNTMLSSRDAHTTTTLLLDIKQVLIVCGLINVRGANTNQERKAPNVILLPSGLVLVTDGFVNVSTNIHCSAEIYD